MDDLKQEGALDLLDAARRFDPSMGTKLLTYATSAIETAMWDCAAPRVPSLCRSHLDRYHQLRQVAFLYATHEQEAEADLLPAIQEKLEVSAKVAKRLLEYRTVFQIESLGERVFRPLGVVVTPPRPMTA
ncbi:MAG: sigma factor [Dysosmobacter sp.]